MASKRISFSIVSKAYLRQSFEIPKNYSVKNKSIEDLYNEIQSKFGDEDSTNVIDCMDPNEFKINHLFFNGFYGYTTEIEGKIIDVIIERKK
jgi:hypothetical protein